jgi:hypothetical protein
VSVDIYEVRRDTKRGSIQGESLWWCRSAAIAEAERLARYMAGRSKRRTLKQDVLDPTRWDVLEADPRWPDRPLVFVSHFVFGRIIQGSAIDRLAEVSL